MSDSQQSARADDEVESSCTAATSATQICSAKEDGLKHAVAAVHDLYVEEGAAGPVTEGLQAALREEDAPAKSMQPQPSCSDDSGNDADDSGRRSSRRQAFVLAALNGLYLPPRVEVPYAIDHSSFSGGESSAAGTAEGTAESSIASSDFDPPDLSMQTSSQRKPLPPRPKALPKESRRMHGDRCMVTGFKMRTMVVAHIMPRSWWRMIVALTGMQPDDPRNTMVVCPVVEAFWDRGQISAYCAKAGHFPFVVIDQDLGNKTLGESLNALRSKGITNYGAPKDYPDGVLALKWKSIPALRIHHEARGYVARRALALHLATAAERALEGGYMATTANRLKGSDPKSLQQLIRRARISPEKAEHMAFWLKDLGVDAKRMTLSAPPTSPADMRASATAADAKAAPAAGGGEAAADVSSIIDAMEEHASSGRRRRHGSHHSDSSFSSKSSRSKSGRSKTESIQPPKTPLPGSPAADD